MLPQLPSSLPITSPTIHWISDLGSWQTFPTSLRINRNHQRQQTESVSVYAIYSLSVNQHAACQHIRILASHHVDKPITPKDFSRIMVLFCQILEEFLVFWSSRIAEHTLTWRGCQATPLSKLGLLHWDPKSEKWLSIVVSHLSLFFSAERCANLDRCPLAIWVKFENSKCS